jgi:hypothetical protein
LPLSRRLSEERFDRLIRRAALSRVFVSKPAENIYFGNATAVEGCGLLYERTQTSSSLGELPRIEVIDLPSITDGQYRLLAASSILETIWVRARGDWQNALEKASQSDERVPTFIVLDEAHNLIPAEPRNLGERRLREQFRTVAAEGRKFGLFLILVSQRPDKLDPLVVSECENRAVMKLGSELVLYKTVELLGLGGLQKRTVEKCLEFETGRALIAGPWASGGTKFLYGAPRRTEEGGRNLRSAFWAVPAAIAPLSPEQNKPGRSSPVNRKGASTAVARARTNGTKVETDAPPTDESTVPRKGAKRGPSNKTVSGGAASSTA